MKTIKIPSTMIPYRVIVNGKEYVYEAGATVEVPDEVAIAIENSVAAAEDLVRPSDNTPSGGDQSDWNQTDETAADFIKNKPFWQTIKNQRVIYAEQSFSVDAEQGGIPIDYTLFTLEEDGYIVKFDGVEYEYRGLNNTDAIMFGNLSRFGYGEDTGEPFVVAVIPTLETAVIIVADENDHTVGIIGGITETKKIGTMYLYKSLALYTDGTYLYKSNDISDVTNRAGVVTLETAFNAGVSIYIALDASNGTSYFPVTVSFLSDLNTGVRFAAVQTIDDRETLYYTAEYTG